ncbi:MAG TPA: hypothetical protein VMW64_00920 [Dehalococcoidia bacterium]|nr:hypothetical protein [Dehalococcoidia bacterium]
MSIPVDEHGDIVPEPEEEHVKPVDGQCGTCRWGKIDSAPSPSGPEDGVN